MFFAAQLSVAVTRFESGGSFWRAGTVLCLTARPCCAAFSLCYGAGDVPCEQGEDGRTTTTAVDLQSITCHAAAHTLAHALCERAIRSKAVEIENDAQSSDDVVVKAMVPPPRTALSLPVIGSPDSVRFVIVLFSSRLEQVGAVLHLSGSCMVSVSCLCPCVVSAAERSRRWHPGQHIDVPCDVSGAVRAAWVSVAHAHGLRVQLRAGHERVLRGARLVAQVRV